MICCIGGGGTREERRAADRELRECVTAKSNGIMGAIMYSGVRIGVVRWLPTPFCWGSGREYPQSGPQGSDY